MRRNGALTLAADVIVLEVQAADVRMPQSLGQPRCSAIADAIAAQVEPLQRQARAG